jgi:predicted nucleic acid-binding protein
MVRSSRAPLGYEAGLIGAHAAVRRYRLLTRDAARYRTYFPTVELIAP